MATKACVACNQQIAASFQRCNFCKAEQPAVAAPAPAKEARCATCKRPYSAKLTECPFCARDRAAGLEPAAFGTRRTSQRPELGALDDDEDVGDRTLGSAALFGVPLIAGAIWGVVEVVYTTRLGGEESSATTSPSVVVALFVAPVLAVLFVRRARRTLEDAIESLGLSKTILLGFGATVIAFVPIVLFVTGFIQWWNAMGIDAHAQVVECKVGSVWQRIEKGKDKGWSVSYTCDVEGDHLVGTASGLAARPDLTEGGPVYFQAARGRFGRWVRLGEPTSQVLPTTTVSP